jgi:3-hydroxybutyryl-CoA dehydratase
MNEYKWTDLGIGMTAGFEATITAQMLDTFRALSGDLNPLHGDEAFARARGFDGVVLHGMLVSALYSQLVGMHLPGRNCLLHEIKVTFGSPAYAGDALRVSGTVTHLNGAYRQAEIKARIVRASELISRATIRVGVHE